MGDWADSFLLERDPVPWQAPEGFPAKLAPCGLFSQPKGHGLEVVLTQTATKPTGGTLRKAWHKRKGKRASPVLLLAGYPTLHGDRVAVCGPVGSQPPVVFDLEVSQIERLADVALSEPDHHSATRCLLTNIGHLDDQMPGLRNVGLFATHELVHGVPARSDWRAATRAGQQVIRATSQTSASRGDGMGLVRALGFEIGSLATGVSVLKADGEQKAVAIFCEQHESFDSPSLRLNGITPVSLALAQAVKADIDWVILTRGTEIRLYAAKNNVGVGRRGRAETFVEANLALFPDSNAGYLYLIFSAEALSEGGYVSDILEASERFASDLAVRLRERVYNQAVPALSQAVAARMSESPDSQELDDAYQQVLVILFRLLFIAYAEDKDLLPYRSNSQYAERSLSELAKERLICRAQQPSDANTEPDAA